MVLWDNQIVKHHDERRHPGPMQFMRVDSESAGIIIALGFVGMGLVALPFAKWFLLAALTFGGAFALLLHFVRQKPSDISSLKK